MTGNKWNSGGIQQFNEGASKVKDYIIQRVQIKRPLSKKPFSY
jgi:hypothetical protein